MILLAAQGWQNKDIADEVALDRRQVALWRQRFLQGGIDAVRQDAPRSGRTPAITAEADSQILEVTLHSKPAAAAHWSTRTLAEHLGLGATSIRRIWQRNGIKPHLAHTFKLSPDPRFEDKLLDVGRCDCGRSSSDRAGAAPFSAMRQCDRWLGRRLTLALDFADVLQPRESKREASLCRSH